MVDADDSRDPARQLRPDAVDPIFMILGDHTHILARTISFHLRSVVSRRPGRDNNAYHRSPVLEPGHSRHIGPVEIRSRGRRGRSER